MKVHNIHERELPASPLQVGALIDSLSSRNDALWPRPCWPRMAFDRPLFFRPLHDALLEDTLLPQLADRGLCNAHAGIALPGDASMALRRSAGFRTIGVLPAVGRKLGRWHERLVVSAALPLAAAQSIHDA